VSARANGANEPIDDLHPHTSRDRAAIPALHSPSTGGMDQPNSARCPSSLTGETSRQTPSSRGAVQRREHKPADRKRPQWKVTAHARR
jgi:hypothetical protein